MWTLQQTVSFFCLFSEAFLGDNVMGFNQREAKLAQRVREVEEQNQLLRHQLR